MWLWLWPLLHCAVIVVVFLPQTRMYVRSINKSLLQFAYKQTCIQEALRVFFLLFFFIFFFVLFLIGISLEVFWLFEFVLVIWSCHRLALNHWTTRKWNEPLFEWLHWSIGWIIGSLVIQYAHISSSSGCSCKRGINTQQKHSTTATVSPHCRFNICGWHMYTSIYLWSMQST